MQERVSQRTSDLSVLTRYECLRLLAQVSVARVAWTDSPTGRCVVVPVTCRAEDDAVVFRTSEGEALAHARAGDLLSIEADEVEEASRSGWSVLVSGHAEVVPAGEATALAGQVTPWASGERASVVRIRAEQVSGRRLTPSRGRVQHIWERLT